jgi:4'-phosphopantetheinyl transferase
MTIGTGEVRAWCVKLVREPALIACARSLLSPDELERANGFHSQDLRDDFVLSRGLLRVLLAMHHHVAPAAIRFTYGPHGKPALAASLDSTIRFNISHSAGLFACAIANGCEIGIDVERHRSLSDHVEIARRFFSQGEYDAILRTDDAARTAAFFDCWVRKEALIKALGGGLSIPLDHFDVSVEAGRATFLPAAEGVADDERQWQLHAFSPSAGFSGALAFRDPRKQISIHHAAARSVFAEAGFLQQ